MAIYRPPKARWPLATGAAIAGLIVGLLTGLLIGRDEFDPLEAAQEIESVLTSAAASLEVAAVEYEESVEGGEVTERSEFEGALAALASSREKFTDVRPALESLFPASVEPIDQLYDEAEQAMDAREDPASVSVLLRQLEAMLEGDIE